MNGVSVVAAKMLSCLELDSSTFLLVKRGKMSPLRVPLPPPPPEKLLAELLEPQDPLATPDPWSPTCPRLIELLLMEAPSKNITFLGAVLAH